MHHFLLVLYSILIVTAVKAQDEYTFPKSSDVGLNITNVLSSFIGNSGSDVDVNSYPFVVKVNRKNQALRVGVGFSFDNSDETLATVEQFIFNNFQLNSRVGWEFKKYIGNKFGFFYGLDLVSVYRNKETTVSNNVDITSLIQDTAGIGGGPVYGFEYYINKFMYLGTEGSFYGLYSVTNSREEFTFNPDINTESRIEAFSAQITPPTRLYIMVRF